jgi:hypothetical protein
MVWGSRRKSSQVNLLTPERVKSIIGWLKLVISRGKQILTKFRHHILDKRIKGVIFSMQIVYVG